MILNFDFDLDPMTLILKLDLDMVKMYPYTKNEIPSYSSSKVIAQTDTQTDSTEIIAYPHMRMVIKWLAGWKLDLHNYFPLETKIQF